MDDQFIGQQELILAGIGIVIVVILLVFLSLYQQAQAKQAKVKRVEDLRRQQSGLTDGPPGTTPFFVTIGNKAFFFRVYKAPDELLFLYAGPYFVLIDSESVRAGDQRHWLLSSIKMTAAALASVFVFGGIALVVIGRAVARNVGQNPEAGFDIIFLVMGILGLFALVVLIGVPTTLWGITCRCRELDALSLNELREQAELHPQSFRATLESIDEITIASISDNDSLLHTTETGCYIKFKHTSSGKWQIETPTTEDTKAAIQSIVGIWGRDRVTVGSKLVKRFGDVITKSNLLVDNAEPTDPIDALSLANVHMSAAASTKMRDQRLDPDDTPKLYDDPVPTSGGTFSMNGCGTMPCNARGDIAWTNAPEDSDAVLAFCLFYVPLVPYAAVHTANYRYHDPQVGAPGWLHQTVPIRWSWDLLVAFCIRSYFIPAMIIGVIAAIIGYFGAIGIIGILGLPLELQQKLAWFDRIAIRVVVGVVGVALVILAPATRWLLERQGRRHRDIRLVMGRHLLGSSDPFYWTKKDLDRVLKPTELFGTTTFAEAVPQLMSADQPVAAMFAARLSAALEDADAGQRLTDEILTNDNVTEALEQLRHHPDVRDKFLQPLQWSDARLFDTSK